MREQLEALDELSRTDLTFRQVDVELVELEARVAELRTDVGRMQELLEQERGQLQETEKLRASQVAELEAIAEKAGRPDVFFTSAWGSTETSPLATSAHFATGTTGVLGVPIPGVALKLARVDDRLELRVKGPNVTPGLMPPPAIHMEYACG